MPRETSNAPRLCSALDKDTQLVLKQIYARFVEECLTKFIGPFDVYGFTDTDLEQWIKKGYFYIYLSPR